MRYKLTEGTQIRFQDLLRSIRETRPFLGAATPAVRAEWDTIRGRFPSEDDARQGYTSLSELEIEELRSKVARFAPERRSSATATSSWRARRSPTSTACRTWSSW